MKYHFKIHKEDDGYWAECLELDGCQTEGDDMEELEFNMAEALYVYLDEPISSDKKTPFPNSKLKGKNIVAVAVEPEIAFSLLVRHYRQEKNLSQKEMMKLLGMKNIFSYQRLEKKTDPKLSTLVKIKKVFPEISIDSIIEV